VDGGDRESDIRDSIVAKFSLYFYTLFYNLSIMKKIYFTLFLSMLIISSVKVNSQPEWSWANGYGSTSADYSYSSIVDEIGNIYCTGWYNGPMNMGSNSFIWSGQYDIFLAKFKPNGNLIWAKRYGSSGRDEGNGLCIDHQGYLYLTGCYGGTISFDTITLYATGGSDIFLAKLDTAGNFICVKQGNSNDPNTDQEAIDIAVDENNNIIIAGAFAGTATFSPLSINSNGVLDIFIAKYDCDGNIQWLQSAGGPGKDAAHGIDVDSNGEVYISGFYTDQIDFNGAPHNTSGGQDVFVAKYSSAGLFSWAKYGEGSGTDESPQITIDKYNYCYITGSFSSTIDFDSNLLTSSGGNDIFIIKYDSDGNLVWASKAGGSGNDYALDIRSDSTFLFICGAFQNTANFDTNPVQALGGYDAYVAKYDSSGNNLWVTPAGSSNDDNAFDISITPQNEVVVSGYCKGAGIFGIHTINYNANADIFVAKLSRENLVEIHEIAVDNLLSVYPNPADGNITVQFPTVVSGKMLITIFNMLGQCELIIEEQAFSGRSIEISVENLPASDYDIMIMLDGKIYSGKFIKD
jgi:hypothetical protein